MKFISHRGNLKGPDPFTENKPSQVLNAMAAGYDVEVDVWVINDQYWLGHDKPTYPIDENFLKNKQLWCHVKNVEALKCLSRLKNVHYFWHQSDDYTLTSQGFIWCYPGNYVENGIAVVKKEYSVKLKSALPKNIMAICTDYPLIFDKMIRDAQ